MRGGVLVEPKKDVDDDYLNSSNSNTSNDNNQCQGGLDFQTFNREGLDSNEQSEPFTDFSGTHKATDRGIDRQNGASELDIDLERQPLMLPPNATQAQQVKFSSRRGMDRLNQYGSMATLTFDNEPSSAQSHPLQQHSYATASARSTLSRRPVSGRPGLFLQSSSASDAGLARLSSSYVDRPLSTPIHPSIYAYNRPISTGQLLSMTEAPSSHQQRMESLPAGAISLGHYGYTVDPTYLDSRARVSSYNPGRQSRLSVASSQVFVLQPDPNNKDSNQPVQLLVVQQAEVGLSPLSITTIVAYSFVALHSIVFEEVYALYAVTPVGSHGLGWTAIQLSSSLACMGIVQLLMQFVVYPMLERRFSAVLLFRIAQLLYCCVYISFPLIRAFMVDDNDTETGGQVASVRYLVLAVLVFKYLCSVFSYTSIMVMVRSHSTLALY